jgi:hypothetical protein
MEDEARVRPNVVAAARDDRASPFGYRRADAIRDGVLIDVSTSAREAGIRWVVVCGTNGSSGTTSCPR